METLNLQPSPEKIEAKPRPKISSWLAALTVFGWTLTIIGSLIGAGILIFFLPQAQSAPQEASISAMAAAFGIIPYCFARAIMEICYARRRFTE